MGTIIQIQNLGKTFETVAGPVKALENINLDIQEGEIFGIIGLSGAGKSTLVRCINYLESPTSGDVIYEGKSLADMSEAERRKTRQSMGMIFQQFNLLAQRSVLANVTFPLEIAGVDSKAAKVKARELLSMVGLADREKAYPAQLSGGQRQRVAIARAIATNPKVLLCDEATSALDPTTTKQILDLLKSINSKLGITVIVITHEMRVIESICDRVAIIDHSHIAEVGGVKEIFADPRSRIGRQLILGNITEGENWTRRGNGRILRIIFNKETRNLPLVSDMILNCQASINILFASFKKLSDDDYGQMVIELPVDAEKAEKCLSFLKDKKINFEEVREGDL